MPTKIEWADEVWNPVTGCTKVSEGCKNCYAERMARRLAGRYGYPKAPNHFDVRLHLDRLKQPSQWKKPRMIFICSMGDLFHEAVPDRFVARVLTAMSNADQHTYQILTKRPDRMRELFSRKTWYDDYSGLYQTGRENWWFGVSVENQATADERISLLLQTPAAVRFVSLEPLLEAVNLSKWLSLDQWLVNPLNQSGPGPVTLDWVIVGGESGLGARLINPQWARDIRDQCQTASIPFFFKSWGAWFPRSQWQDNPDLILPDDDCCIEGRNLKILNDDIMHRVGKKRAGRLLDGQLWEQYPKGKENEL